MAKYLIECACGRRLTVEPGQAGESLVCQCGATLAVPTLRQLRQLPEAREETRSTAPAWGLRHAAITICSLLAVVCLILAGLSRSSEPELPKLDLAARAQSVDRAVSNMSPLAAWRMWVESYQSLAATGFEAYKHPATDALQQQITWHRGIRTALLATAAVCVVVAVVLGITKTRRQEAETGRRGDKETRRI